MNKQLLKHGVRCIIFWPGGFMRVYQDKIKRNIKNFDFEYHTKGGIYKRGGMSYPASYAQCSGSLIIDGEQMIKTDMETIL